MRLLALEMQGFGAFRAPTRLAFDDSDFFALVGPTGSGKSTVLDAVCFALYGSVPRYESENLIRYVVTLGALEARVRLDFELDGAHYIATRVARRNNKGVVSTKEARLERVTAGDATEVVAGFEREMSAAVVRLLGLRFDDFTRCVALPQGDFARFLRAKGDERRDLLLRLLNLGVYTELGSTARRLEAEARSQISLIDTELERFAAATPEALEAARSRQTRLATLSAEVEAAQPTLADLAAKEQTALGRAREATEWAERLGRIAVPQSIRTFAERHREAQAALETAAGALTEASAGRKAALAARQPLPDLAGLRAAHRAHDDLAQCVASIAAAEATKQQLDETVERLRAELDAAAEAARDAAESLQALQRQHVAHALAETLVAGEPCPVCDQVVSRLPEHAPVAAVADAKRRVDEREQALVRARTGHAAAEKQVAGAAARLETLADQRAKLAGAVDAHPDAAELDAGIAQVETAEVAVARTQAAENDALEHLETAKAALGRLDTAAQRARNDFTTQRDTVAALAPPPADNRDVLADWEALAGWAAALVPAQQEAAQMERATAETHARSRAQTLASLRAALEDAGVSLPAGVDAMGLVSAVASASTGATHAVAEIEAAMEQAEKQRETRAGLEEDADVAKLLGQLLRADRFPEWLVAEALGLLTVDASEILRQLTGDQFSLAVGDREFVVIDHGNADERRPARTLSGGETFQASLALALALSQQIRNLAAEGAPRLDAIFLDEGFGTLDPETLDVVAATIENLGQTGRMVGVVTHVSELAARVPVRFVVRKGVGTSTVERIAPVKFTVDPWDPSYGTSNELDPADVSKAQIDVDVEVPAAQWAPRRPVRAAPADRLVFVDGVRRVEAHVWIEDGDGTAQHGICASYAAGAVRCDGTAVCGPFMVRRGLFTTHGAADTISTWAGEFAIRLAASASAEGLALAVQERMAETELEAAEAACGEGEVDLVVVDGPLRGRQHLSGAVGYIKTHHVTYLPPELNAVVGRLAPGERSPLFTLGTSWSRLSWYFRLPATGASPWSGVVRGECSANLALAEAAALADRVTAALPRFASEAHKDSRAPQNLYPIAGLERELRHRLGDPQVLYRALRLAAAT